MVKVRKRGETVRQFILDSVEQSSDDIAMLTAQEFGISRQAVNKHIRQLLEQGSLEVTGTTKNRQYSLCSQKVWSQVYWLSDQLQEDLVWTNDILPRLGNLPDNVLDIWNYGFTEMMNNAIDHSAGQAIFVEIEKTAGRFEIRLMDDGEGIFRKIQRELKLLDERHAVLELAKGKLTTDPERHSGQGIFFTSRMFDKFAILSGNVYFSHQHGHPEDWIIEGAGQKSTGVVLRLSNNTARTTKQVFDEFSSGQEYGFNKTVVPVRLAQYGSGKLVSRSQAKRLLMGLDRFRVVVFDFEEVSEIGQAFADEVFRVFRNQHPKIELIPHRATASINQMISRAQAVPASEGMF
jgi:anti-sigma regulatory factor (Ser/Thr protein kinase)